VIEQDVDQTGWNNEKREIVPWTRLVANNTGLNSIVNSRYKFITHLAPKSWVISMLQSP